MIGVSSSGKKGSFKQRGGYFAGLFSHRFDQNELFLAPKVPVGCIIVEKNSNVSQWDASQEKILARAFNQTNVSHNVCYNIFGDVLSAAPVTQMFVF